MSDALNPEAVEAAVEAAADAQAADTLEMAKDIAAEIVDTAEQMAREESDIFATIEAQGEQTREMLRLLDDKINGIFDSLALFDAMLSRLVDLEAQEVAAVEDAVEAIEEVAEVAAEVADGELEEIPEETGEVSEPQKRDEKTSKRKWI